MKNHRTTLALLLVALALPAAALAEKGMLKVETTPGEAQIFSNGTRTDTSPAQAGQTFALKPGDGVYKIVAIKATGGPMEFYGGKDAVFLAENSMQPLTIAFNQRPSAEFKDNLKKKYTNGVPEPKMVAFSADSFSMGCSDGSDCWDREKPVHKVTLAAFQMSATEVTFAQYDACVALGGCDHLPDDKGWGRGERPVINVSWDDAQKYIVWLNKQTGKNYRLPTEAEWECAARAGSTTKYSWGNEVGRNQANCDSCGSQWDNQQTAPVGSFKPNSFGLYDMHGNVWEWCQDWYSDSYYASNPGTNPTGPTSGSYRVARGGSWDYSPGCMLAFGRAYDTPDSRKNNRGFRLVASQIK